MTNDMNSIEHNGASSLMVRRTDRRATNVRWYVVRTCECHKGVRVTAYFNRREEAERALRVLDEDARSDRR